MKEKNFILGLTATKSLKEMGENIKMARLRRHLTQKLVAERASISRVTLTKIEKGDPSVSIGSYAAVLHALDGLGKEFSKVAKDDELGRTIQDLGLVIPRRVRNK